MSYPRRRCPTCNRRIAIPGGRFARHDPPDRIRGFLVSCTGSLRHAPPGGEQPVLFEKERIEVGHPASATPQCELF